MKAEITLVDCGRGLQLSTSRVTVQDLVPYFQEGCSPGEIIRWIPTLSREEIAVVERYYRDHQHELDEEDQHIREQSAHRKNPPWVEKIAAEARAAPDRHGEVAGEQVQRRGQVKGILADIDIQGHVDLLVTIMQAEPWQLFWHDLGLRYCHFTDVGLAPSAPDSQVWDVCQAEELVLLTDNRNQNDVDSLETTIRARNTLASLPVITIANVPRLRQSREYANRVIDKLLDFLMRMDTLRGTGRLFVP